MISIIVIVPVALLDAANQITRAFSYDDVGTTGSFTVPLSASGKSPATHRGAHIWAHQDFSDMLDQGLAGTLSPLPQGVTSQSLQSLLSSFIISKQTGAADPGTHFSSVLTANGLSVISTGAPA